MISSLLHHVTIDIGPLRRHRDFRLFIVGRGVASWGNGIREVAIPYPVYTLPHSSLAVGLLGLAELGPLLTFAFVGGALADAVDRRKMMLLTELGMSVVAAGLVGNALLTHSQLWALYAGMATLSSLDALQRPSTFSLMPRLVERGEIAAAAALWSATGPTAGLG